MNYIDVPTFENDVWSITTFKTREEFRDFILSIFKEPGKYTFDQTSLLFNQQARVFDKDKVYCMAPIKSKDYIKYWDDQKEKCIKGVIFKNDEKIWYLTREYYQWINFLPIYDKEEKKYGFPKVWDSQYHTALYELLAELHYKHVALLKKRQWGSSYFHCAKLINRVWFDEGVTLKMGASLKDYINEKGSWKFLNEYKSFLDQYTAWYRPMNPGKVLIWQQQIEVILNGRKTTQGNKGTIQGLTFDKDPTSGVGGPCAIFYHEEAGIAPNMDTTFEYATPAMKVGTVKTTGVFIAAGSVGDLEQCEPLKQMILYPEGNDIYAIETNLLDDKGTIGMTGLFIPEQWSMPPFIDKFGNSLIEEANLELDRIRVQWKKELTPEKFQLRISQSPRNIQEAFAYRKLAVFPPHLVNAQLKRIEEKEYAYEFLDIYRDTEGKVAVKETMKLPILDFPISPKLEDKTGCLVVWERPVKDPEFRTYYASIDPVSEGKSVTSNSLVSIIIYKNAIKVTKVTDRGTETYIEKDKIVASWCGRFDDINDTHERLEMIVEWYNAWTIVENNVSHFIRHMIERKKQRYLVPKDQMLFLKELSANQNVFQDYGWKNTGVLFKTTLLSYGIEFLSEVLETTTKEDGTIVKTIYGAERIPDPMILKEMLAYQPGMNVDRLVAYCSLVAFVAIQRSNIGIKNRIEDDSKKNLENSKNIYTLNKGFFKNLGHNQKKSGGKSHRSPFHNIH